ncbi:MAG: cobalt ECF transporter T component CbiQ [Desulfobacteraceae bacterium]|nr:cobalt ECF transporter T component CbiQ [Desulfobacteraceae bacterium]
MIEETFAEGKSAIHRSNPPLRTALAVIYSFTVALTNDTGALILALFFSMGLALLARLPIKALLKRLGAAAGFLLFVWLVVPWTYESDVLWSFGPVAVSAEGVNLCWRVTLKTFAILTAFTALAATMHLATLGHALHSLGVPSKLIQLLLLTYRYLFIIETEYQRLYRAAKIRNFRPSSNIHTYKTFAYLLAMMFVRASERAKRVYQAMKCRGFDGRFHTIGNYSSTVWNPILCIGVLLVSAVIAGLEFTS